MSTTTPVGQNNLLLALHKYAHQQDENFTTEAFVHLLRHVQVFEPEIARFLIRFLTGERIKLTDEDCPKLKISTQNTFMEGRPDILIEGPTHFIIIEVKVESQPGWDQLDRYREILNTKEEADKCLVLLTRYSVEPNEAAKVDSFVRWDRIARVLNRALEQTHDRTCAFLIRQLLQFLIERGMAMEKVGWELVRGVQSLMNLMSMLGEAVTAAKVRQKSPTAGIEFFGRYLYIDDTECWTGVYYSKPQIIVFESYKINKANAESVGLGNATKDSKGTYKWTNELDLESEEVHFFALSPDNQQARIQRFISECISAVKTIGANSR